MEGAGKGVGEYGDDGDNGDDKSIEYESEDMDCVASYLKMCLASGKALVLIDSMGPTCRRKVSAFLMLYRLWTLHPCV